MGSFRSPLARIKGQHTITADRPPDIPELDEVGERNWLDEGESITYWRVLPHSVSTAMVTAGTKVEFNRKGKPRKASYDAGAAVRTRLVNGIVGWVLKDENGTVIEWDPERGDELLNGLPGGVYAYLLRQVGSGAPEPDLDELDPETAREGPDGELVGETVGEDSAGS